MANGDRGLLRAALLLCVRSRGLWARPVDLCLIRPGPCAVMWRVAGAGRRAAGAPRRAVPRVPYILLALWPPGNAAAAATSSLHSLAACRSQLAHAVPLFFSFPLRYALLTYALCAPSVCSSGSVYTAIIKP